jgi:antitoxin component of MazEF toxin-antitoxin module
LTKIIQIGNSLGVTLPKTLIGGAKLRKGTRVAVRRTGRNLTIVPIVDGPPPRRRRRKYKLADLLARCAGPNPYAIVGDDTPVGTEYF